MIGSIFGKFGAMIGESFGGGMISTLGRFFGRAVGNYLEEEFITTEEFYKNHKHLDNLFINFNTEGKIIPQVYGTGKVDGEIIWALPIREVMSTSTEERSNNKYRRIIYNHNNFFYYATFAVGICEGEISDIGRVWAGEELIDLEQYKFRLYKGTSDQVPDQAILESNTQATAFRDIAYIVFLDMPLEDFGNAVPKFSFEVFKKSKNSTRLPEDLVKEMIIIPGSGEFVYDTKVQKKITQVSESLEGVNTKISERNINCNNYQNIPDAIFNLNQLQLFCKNIEWLAPVVCWFGNSLNVRDCEITPRVEFKDAGSNTSEEWNVGGLTRERADLISMDQYGSPNYGGTINDQSLVRYLLEVKKRGLKIMLYPMFLLDIDQKPWRGRVSGDPDDIFLFFNKPNGYKNFILHYARLTKGLIDALVIGSELIGLTKIRKGESFPAVKELTQLAREVKQIVGQAVTVTYAADWSEYHHTTDGFYNLDELWASDDIDVIGIDAYFPITKSKNSNIKEKDIKDGWSSLEGYDFYLNNGEVFPLAPEWAWKNIEYWWSNYHYNPGGQKTKWIPRSKKIWFTEFGFPSIDKATNQPNVFYDPKCIDGGIPIYSKKLPDFLIQKNAIRATIDYFNNSTMVEKKFLWTWDARPYPAFPHTAKWKDANLWRMGHWVNGKFSSILAGDLINEICINSGLDEKEVVIENNLDDIASGFVIKQEISGMDLINNLRCIYFFDMHTADTGQIVFRKRNYDLDIIHYANLSVSELIKYNDYSLYNISKSSFKSNIDKISINFINQIDYSRSRKVFSFDGKDAIYNISINLSAVLTDIDALNIAQNLYASSISESDVIIFKLPIDFSEIKCNDYLMICDDINHIIIRCRVTDIKINGYVIEVYGSMLEI